MKRTTNYALPTWEKSDFIQMSDFNDLTQKTDAALKANADAIGEKAAAAALEALAQNLGVHGRNARIAFGSYTGTGTYGSANPNTLQFDFKPMLVFVAIAAWDSGVENPIIFLRNRTAGSSTPSYDRDSKLVVSWTDTAVSWYMTSSETAYYQLNHPDAIYYYTAIGYDE